jgi:hypothetical protein
LSHHLERASEAPARRDALDFEAGGCPDYVLTTIRTGVREAIFAVWALVVAIVEFAALPALGLD